MGLSKAQLIAKIEKRIFIFEGWTTGISEDPTQRRKEFGNPPGWCHWEADNENTAREVEKHVLDKGCKGRVGGVDHPHWVYVFIH